MAGKLINLKSLSYWKYTKLKKCPTLGAYPKSTLGLPKMERTISKSQILGEFFHAVMETFNECDPATAFNASKINEKFNGVLANYDEMLRLDKKTEKMSKLSSWPEVSEIYSSIYELFSNTRDVLNKAAQKKVFAEKLIFSNDSLLSGKIDAYIMGNNVIDLYDYKSGTIDKESGSFEDYRDQLYFYAYLIHEKHGIYPTTIRLVGKDLAMESIPPAPTKSIEIADRMRKTLELYNQRVEESPLISDNTSASNEGCRFCDYKPYCETFWKSLSDVDTSEYDHIVVGLQNGSIEFSRSGVGAITLRVEKGTVSTEKITLGKFLVERFSDFENKNNQRLIITNIRYKVSHPNSGELTNRSRIIKI